MRNTRLLVAICLAPLAFLAPGTSAVLAQQQTVTFLCLAPAGHVCQFTVRTGVSPISFALPSGERSQL